MAKKDSVELLKKRCSKLQEELDGMTEANAQIQMVLDAILREVIRQCGAKNDRGELVLIVPTPNLFGAGKVLAAKEGDSYVLTLTESKEGGAGEEQMGESCAAEAGRG